MFYSLFKVLKVLLVKVRKLNNPLSCLQFDHFNVTGRIMKIGGRIMPIHGGVHHTWISPPVSGKRALNKIRLLHRAVPPPQTQ